MTSSCLSTELSSPTRVVPFSLFGAHPRASLSNCPSALAALTRKNTKNLFQKFKCCNSTRQVDCGTVTLEYFRNLPCPNSLLDEMTPGRLWNGSLAVDHSERTNPVTSQRWNTAHIFCICVEAHANAKDAIIFASLISVSLATYTHIKRRFFWFFLCRRKRPLLAQSELPNLSRSKDITTSPSTLGSFSVMRLAALARRCGAHHYPGHVLPHTKSDQYQHPT